MYGGHRLQATSVLVPFATSLRHTVSTAAAANLNGLRDGSSSCRSNEACSTKGTAHVPFCNNNNNTGLNLCILRNILAFGWCDILYSHPVSLAILFRGMVTRTLYKRKDNLR